MDITRRNFLQATGAAVATRVPSVAVAATRDDPLGCRADFPVLENRTYLNSPYIAPCPQPVTDAAIDFDRAKSVDPIRLGAMLEETQALRQGFAKLVGADLSEIGLLSTTSEGENVVTAAMDFKPGDVVVIDDLHYDTTVLLYDHLVKEKGIELRVVKSEDGAVPMEAFADVVSERTRLVSVSWVSHQNGFRHELEPLATLAHAYDAYLYVDAIQGVGAIPLDVRQTGVDFFTAGSYKWLLGGFGVAPFYVREALLDEVPMDRVGWRQLESGDPHDGYRFYRDARKYGYATPAFGAIYQLKAALDYLDMIGVQRIATHTIALAGVLNRELRSLGFTVLTPQGNESATVAFEHGVEPTVAAERLKQANISVSLRERGTQIRAGIALFNNRQDIARLIDVVGKFRS